MMDSDKASACLAGVALEQRNVHGRWEFVVTKPIAGGNGRARVGEEFDTLAEAVPLAQQEAERFQVAIDTPSSGDRGAK